MTATYDLTNRQRGYARYLMRLNDTRRANLMRNMKQGMADKMQNLIRDEQAHAIQQWNNEIARLYLRALRNKSENEYEEIIKRIPDIKVKEYNLDAQ